jgi:hypothetical protein
MPNGPFWLDLPEILYRRQKKFTSIEWTGVLIPLSVRHPLKWVHEQAVCFFSAAAGDMFSVDLQIYIRIILAELIGHPGCLARGRQTEL